jgi:toxin HigB-1
VIRSFRSKALSAFAAKGNASKLPVQNVERVRRILARLNAVRTPEDMNVPGFFFHGLIGDHKGRYSVRVTGNWRITFAWDGLDATDVDLEDYH